MASNGKFRKFGTVQGERKWKHPDFPDSYFIELTKTTGTDAVWTDELCSVEFDDEIFSEAMDELDVSEGSASAGDSQYGVKTEHGWFSVDPREKDLYVLLGLHTRHPFGSTELKLFERFDET